MSSSTASTPPTIALRPEDIQLLIAILKQLPPTGINLQAAADEMEITKNAITKRWKALRGKLFGDVAVGASAKTTTKATTGMAGNLTTSKAKKPVAKKMKRKRAEVEDDGEEKLEDEASGEGKAEEEVYEEEVYEEEV